MVSTISNISTGKTLAKSLEQWRLRDCVDIRSGFIYLDRLVGVSFFELLKDNYLAEVALAVSERHSSSPSRLVALTTRRSSLPWLPSLYPTLIKRFEKDCVSHLLVHPEIAQAYLAVSEFSRKTLDWNRSGQEIFCQHLTLHYLARNSAFGYGDIVNSTWFEFFPDCEAILIDTHHLRFLYLKSDDGKSDLLFCLESQLVGLSYGDLIDKNLWGLPIDLGILDKLPFFEDRFYFPLWYLEHFMRYLTNLRKVNSQIDVASKISIYTCLLDFLAQTDFEQQMSYRMSNKLCALAFIRKSGYLSPFDSQV